MESATLGSKSCAANNCKERAWRHLLARPSLCVYRGLSLDAQYIQRIRVIVGEEDLKVAPGILCCCETKQSRAAARLRIHWHIVKLANANDFACGQVQLYQVIVVLINNQQIAIE